MVSGREKGSDAVSQNGTVKEKGMNDYKKKLNKPNIHITGECITYMCICDMLGYALCSWLRAIRKYLL